MYFYHIGIQKTSFVSKNIYYFVLLSFINHSRISDGGIILIMCITCTLGKYTLSIDSMFTVIVETSVYIYTALFFFCVGVHTNIHMSVVQTSRF